MDALVDSVPTLIWWILGVIIAPSLLALLSVVSILSIALRTTGGTFSLRLPFGAHLEMGTVPLLDRRRSAHESVTRREEDE